MSNRLFPIEVAELQWLEFAAEGYSRPVAGVVFRAGQSRCGLPLGGVGTGCVDLDTDGTLGRCSIFNSFAPPRVLNVPFLAVAVGPKVWGLTTRRLPGLASARQIHYWGHYPIADLEYEVEGPLSVGLRAWSPFLPGDAAASNTPGAVFEVRLRNQGKSAQKGWLVFSFPGPTPEESGAKAYRREKLSGSLRGVAVVTEGGVGFALGVMELREPRLGGTLGPEATGWARIATELPPSESADAGASLAVDFELRAEEEQTLRLVLAWYHPRWVGTPAHHYRHAYAKRFRSAGEVAEVLARQHDSLLKRVIGWQTEIYREAELPLWLRDQLVNVLHTIPEDSFWASDSIPPEDWYGPTGIFALTESPRSVPHICNPSDWYGVLPIVFFFPELDAALLRTYVHFQLANGEVPLGIGEGADLATPTYHLLHTLNSLVHTHLVDRLWQQDQNEGVLREFYPSVKRAMNYTKTLDRDGDGLPDLEPDPVPNQYYGKWPWYGTAVHVDGLWLAALGMAERMARQAGDSAFAQDCRLWQQVARRSLEEKLWGNEWYWLYHDTVSGRKSDTLMANQLAGQCCAHLHGLPRVFPPERVEKVLASVKRLCMAATPYGVINAIRPDGSLDRTGSPLSDGIFTGECLAVAMTLAYAGDRKTGEEVARRLMDDIVLRQGVGWDLPNSIDAATGNVVFGTDFYQMMILWGLPLAMSGQSIHQACSPGTLIDRILKAAGNRSHG